MIWKWGYRLPLLILKVFKNDNKKTSYITKLFYLKMMSFSDKK